MESQYSIDPECHIPHHSIRVLGSKMHFLREGRGDPIVFVHGMPTSSYLWRNIIPSLTDLGSCIAPDLIGMGNSDKPDIEYTVFDHIHYFSAFMEALDLNNITLVLHGWGSVIGFAYAFQHCEKIKALAFYEAHLNSSFEWENLSLPVQHLSTLLRRPGASYRAIVEHNYLINKLMPYGALRKLTEKEMEYYRSPFLTPESRKPLWQYISEVPLGENGPPPVKRLIDQYSAWLRQSPLPKLLLYAVPGFMTTMESVRWARENFPNLTLAELENALHFAQETIPHIFAGELRKWIMSSNSR